jgi:hypothetical protein
MRAGHESGEERFQSESLLHVAESAQSIPCRVVDFFVEHRRFVCRGHARLVEIRRQQRAVPRDLRRILAADVAGLVRVS